MLARTFGSQGKPVAPQPVSVAKRLISVLNLVTGFRVKPPASYANVSYYQRRRVSQRLEGRTSLTFSLQVSSHFPVQRGPLSSKLTHLVYLEGIHFARAWRRLKRIKRQLGSWWGKVELRYETRLHRRNAKVETLVTLVAQYHVRFMFNTVSAFCLLINVFVYVMRLAGSNDPRSVSVEEFSVLHKQHLQIRYGPPYDLRNVILLLYWPGLPVTAWDKLKKAFQSFQFFKGMVKPEVRHCPFLLSHIWYTRFL